MPARGGSKRIKNKNLRGFCGKPLIRWTLEAADAARTISRVIVSTDDLEIADAAIYDTQAEVLLRPEELAADDSPVRLTELHVLDHLAEQGYKPHAVVRLQPTSPLRSASDIDSAVWMLSSAPAVVSVSPVTDHPWLVREVEGSKLVPYDVPFTVPRQDYPPLYRINGAIYAAQTDFWREHDYYTNQTKAYIMPRDRGWDIDDETDWQIAEGLHGTHNA